MIRNLVLPVICCFKVFSSISTAAAMSSVPSKSNYPKPPPPFPKTLAKFGYGFTPAGVMKKIHPTNGKLTEEGFKFENQNHYDALGDVITEHVYGLLVEKGLTKIYIPDDVPEDQATFIFATKDALKAPKKLMILIHGSGVVRAGQWARSLIINHSLNHGTQIPYIEKAQSLGYEVIITNTNDNTRTIDGVRMKIPGNSSPTEHASSVWEKYIMTCKPESVSIVAHSYGGVVTMDLIRKYSDFFQEKVFAIGLTDSVHTSTALTKENLELVKRIGRNWVTSSNTLDEFLRESPSDMPLHSAGHNKHEWTSFSCMTALFDFFESKYEQFSVKGSVSEDDRQEL